MSDSTGIQPKFKQITVMILMTAFQIICCVSLLEKSGYSFKMMMIFFGYICVEWLYMLFGSIITGNDYFELESIAFFLSGIGLTVCASISEDYALKQLIALLAGIVVYLVMLILIKDVNIAETLRYPFAICSLGLLGLNLLLANRTNGALNWISLGGISIQPSEFVKVAFILVSSVSLDRLLSNTSLTKYIIFSLACVGCLALMSDFGAALIFFFTFILIAYMRSGDVRTLVLICSAALMGALVVLYFKPYVASRFASYRHVWEDMNGGGYQQTRVLMYSASGGLLGLGVGEGKLRNIFAASTDLVFGLICEEFGILIGISVLMAFALLTIFAIKAASGAASSFHAIAAVASAGMLLFQLALNVFGVTDILPLTGVTMPFVSRGGSSMICSWGLLAYIRAAGAPFKLPEIKTVMPVDRRRRFLFNRLPYRQPFRPQFRRQAQARNMQYARPQYQQPVQQMNIQPNQQQYRQQPQTQYRQQTPQPNQQQYRQQPQTQYRQQTPQPNQQQYRQQPQTQYRQQTPQPNQQQYRQQPQTQYRQQTPQPNQQQYRQQPSANAPVQSPYNNTKGGVRR